MALQLILGSSGAGKSHYLYERVIDEACKESDGHFFVIVPEQFTMSTQRDFVEMHPRKGIMNIEVLSFLRLSLRIFGELSLDEGQVLEDLGKALVLRRVLEERKDRLGYFKGNVRSQGLVDEMKSLISELFQYSVSVEDLERICELSGDRPMLRRKLEDVCEIYRGFQDFLRERYITAEEILDVLCDALDASELIRDSVVCLDGFTGFTPSQYKVLEKLLSYAREVRVTVTVDAREDISREGEDFQLFHLSKKTIRKLADIASSLGVEVRDPIYAGGPNGVPYRFLGSPPLRALERNIFRYPFAPYPERQDDVSIHSLATPREEVSFVIGRILHLVREEGYRYREVAVVTGDVARYGRLFEEACLRAGIPCFLDDKRAIAGNPFVKLLDGLLDLFIRNFDYDGVFQYLRSGMAGLSGEEADWLDNYALARGVRGFRRWDEPFEGGAPGVGEERLAYVNGLRERLMGPIRKVRGAFSGKSHTVEEYTRALYDFSLEMDAAGKLARYQEQFEARGDLLSAKEYGQAYRFVMEVLERLLGLLGDERMSVREYKEILDAGFAEGRVGLIPAVLDQVVVGDMERTRLKDIRALFVVGANEGVLPKAAEGGGILSDGERELLRERKVELAPTRREAIYTGQFYLYLNLTKPQDKLFLTYCGIGQDGRRAKPSYLVGRILQLFPAMSVTEEGDGLGAWERALGADRGRRFLLRGIARFGEGRPGSGMTAMGQRGEGAPGLESGAASGRGGAGNGMEREIWGKLLSWYQSPEGREDAFPVESYIRAALFRPISGPIGSAVASALYGSPMWGSVTRLEQYAGCAYSHFLAYGLRLQERQEFRLRMPDLGNVFHSVLELYARELDRRGLDWPSVSDEERDRMVDVIVDQVTGEYGNAIFQSSRRNEYMVSRVRRIAKRTLWAVTEQLRAGSFVPKGYEMRFSHMEDLEAATLSLDEGEMRLSGRIDRMDVMEGDGGVYVKVVDYKSGKMAFDVVDLYYGLQLQLAVYLDAAMEAAGAVYPGKEILPGGIFYYPIDDPIVDREAGGDVSDALLRELRVDGLVNARPEVVCGMDESFREGDAGIRPSVRSKVIPVETLKSGGYSKGSSVATEEDFLALLGFARGKLRKLGNEMLAGKIERNPYQLSGRTACDFCPYQGICGFDKSLGDRFRVLAKESEEEVWKRIRGGK